MPSNPAEPEKYSLDDMLERLQGKTAPNPEDSGELVTRADGSQAIKVRKRKRRSTQPHKEAAKRNLRMRAIQISSGVILVILLVLTFGALIVYANSAPYRAKLLSRFNTATGAQTEFQQVRVTPTGTNAARVDFTWPAGNIVKSLSVTNVRAQALIGGVIGGHWGVNEISATNGSLHIAGQVPGQPLRFTPKAGGDSPVSFGRLSVDKMNLTVGDLNSPAMQILETETTFYPSKDGSVPSVRLVRGEMKLPHWPLFRIDRSLMELHGPKLEIVTLRLLHELDPTGNIELSGQLDPEAVAGGQKLGVSVSDFNLNGIAGTSLGHLVAGRIDSAGPEDQNQLTFSSAEPEGKLRLAFASSFNNRPKLNNFPFLAKLWKLTENPWFVDPLFHDGCTGVLHRDRGTASITQLAILSKSQMSVTGELSVQANDVLTGTLNIGLPEAAVIGSRNPRIPEIFADSRDGFRWITLKISGTASRPIDNFDDIAGNAPMSPDSEPGDLFDRLTAPQGQ